MEPKTLVVDGLMTRYGMRGTGKTVLMLHGWGDSMATFDELSGQLAEQFHVVAVDLPGFGQTQAPPAAWGLAEYAEFVSAFISKTGINPAVIVGHSNGGAIAIKLLNAGQHAERLVLLASAGIRSPKSIRKQALKLGAKGAKILSVGLPRRTRAKLRNKLYSVIDSDYALLPHMEDTFKRVVAEDVLPIAANIRIPTLLIYGTEDTATPTAYGERFAAAIPDAQLQVLSGSGHFVHHEQPAQTAKLIKEFIRD